MFLSVRCFYPTSCHYVCLVIVINASRCIAVMFCSWHLRPFFFQQLISELVWLIVTILCHMFDGDPNLKILSGIWGPSEKVGSPKTLDREYLRNATRYRQMENGVANCDHSRTCIHNLVNFDLQMAKIGLKELRHAQRHCHAFLLNLTRTLYQ